jgi:hypothetical protein
MKDKSQTGALPQPLVIEFESVADKFMQTVVSIEQDDINRVPFEGSWTAAQVIEHIRLSVSGTVTIINAAVKTTNRSPDQFAKAIKDLFLDFDAVYPTAPVLVPADKAYDKEVLTAQLKPIFDTLQADIQTKDMTDTCLAAEFTGMGYLTRLEWVTVAIYHTKRHIHQLHKLIQHLVS